jgi:hypothetical protein
LQGLQRLRTDLRAWDVVAAPAMEIVIPRSPWDALKECFALFPLWGRGAFALGSAAAMLLMAFGTMSLLRGTNQTVAPPTGTLATQQPNASPSAVTPVIALTPELKAQVEAQVAAAVNQAVEKEKQAFRSQLSSFETRNTEQQTRIQTAMRQLRDLQTRHEAMLADQQPSLRRMMAEYTTDSANER